MSTGINESHDEWTPLADLAANLRTRVAEEPAVQVEDPQTFNAGIFRCTPDLFAGLLQLPPGSYVDAVWVAQDCPGVIEFRVRGPAWPKVTLGHHVPQVHATFTQATYPDGMVAYRAEWKA
jgi:hypothetical protein